MMKRRVTVPVDIIWFKRDLRVQDHRLLAAAAAGGPVLPVYIVEPELWRQPDASGRHWHFICESLVELNQDLARLGQPLAVRIGDAVEVLEALRRSGGIRALWSHEETGNRFTYARDRAVAAWARQHGLVWHELPQNGVRRGLVTRGGWATRWDRLMAEPITPAPLALAPVPGWESRELPSARDLGLNDDPCPDRQKGGRAAGLRLLATFLADRGRTYRSAMSDPLSAARSCSRLSPHLAFGTVSLRETAQATWARLRELKGDRSQDARAFRSSLVSFSARLHWHCHFMQKLESEPEIEFRELHPLMRGTRPELADATRIAAWAKGETGYPFFDACMRSLNATGWLNFRMRAMLISFASYNLWLPWRATGLHLARQFTDYEPGIHWPQTQMQSGTTGINTIRMYSVIKQGYDQDPTGSFVRRWLPELEDIADACLHEPWTCDRAAAILGKHYPERIVELRSSAATARHRIHAARRGADFVEGAANIQGRYGSRRAAITAPPAVKRAAGTRRKTQSKKRLRQLVFDL
jgi:deoxyribodipyrimidine photo-lyase